jgi:hypothetical protein
MGNVHSERSTRFLRDNQARESAPKQRSLIRTSDARDADCKSGELPAILWVEPEVYEASRFIVGVFRVCAIMLGALSKGLRTGENHSTSELQTVWVDVSTPGARD